MRTIVKGTSPNEDKIEFQDNEAVKFYNIKQNILK